MNYEEFLQLVELRVKQSMGGEVRTCIIPIMKNNSVKLDGLSILEENDNISPAIYLNDFFHQYLAGKSLDEIVNQIIDYYHKAKCINKLDTTFFTEFERVKDHMVCRVINLEKNRKLLQEIPYRSFLDLAIVYYCLVDHEVIGNAAVLIRKEFLDLWNLKEEQLHEIALKNTKRMLPCEFMSMKELLQSIVPNEYTEYLEEEEAQIPMFVLSNSEKCFGAFWMIDGNIQERIGKQLGDDYYILPSSVHECMIVPASNHSDETMLREMVRDINRTQVAPEEVLSDSIYRYDREKKILNLISDEIVGGERIG